MVVDTLLENPVLSAAVAAVIVIWLYCYFSCGVCRSKARMDGKTVIITGCTSGIGKATALDLAKRGARVIMACRNLDKAHSVRESIIASTKNNNVVVKVLDVSLLSSVRRFAEEVIRSERRLDVLIHNAGVALGGKNTTAEGLNTVWATNHFGGFLLTHLLIDLLKRTKGSRIVVVSSEMHYLGSWWSSADKPNPVDETSIFRLYATSKFANVVFANELARRLEGSGVTANSLHPGAIVTPIFDHCPLWLRVYTYCVSPFYKTEEQGAQTTIYLAVSEEVEGVTGKYFTDCKVTSPAKKSLDVGLAKKYWDAWEDIVQLKTTDPHI